MSYAMRLRFLVRTSVGKAVAARTRTPLREVDAMRVLWIKVHGRNVLPLKAVNDAIVNNT